MKDETEHIVQLVKEKYPDCEVEGVIPFKGKYIVSISFSDDDPELGLANFHEVDLITGKVSGNIPTFDLTLDPEFIEVLLKTRPLKKR